MVMFFIMISAFSVECLWIACRSAVVFEVPFYLNSTRWDIQDLSKLA